MEEADYFERLRAAHEDFVNSYRNVRGSNYFNSEDPQLVMETQQLQQRSLPRSRGIRWRIPPMQSTSQYSGSVVQLTTTRWASCVLDRLPTSIFQVDSEQRDANSYGCVVANTVEAARRASLPACGGTNFHLIPEQQNENAVVPVNQLPVSPSRGKPECEICLSEYEHNDRLRHLPCGHSFHAECIDRWLRTAENCPKCRDNVVRTLRRMQVQAVRRRTRSAENNSAPSSVHTESVTTVNNFRNQSASMLERTFNRAPSSTDEPPETRASLLRRLHAAQRLHNSVSSAMAERERFLQIEPAQNRASILRRVHGEQRRAEAEILSMNLAARMASTLSLDSGQWTPSGASSPRQQETSQVSQPSVSASSVEARRKAVEAALRRLGRSS